MRNKRITRLLVFVVAAMVMIAGAAVSVSATSVPSATGYVKSSNGVNMRKSASTSGAKVGELENNTKVTITGQVYTTKKSTASRDCWFKVTANGKTGYIRSDLIKNVKHSTVTGTVRSRVNYRKGAGTSMKNVGILKAGTKVNVVLPADDSSRSLNWYKIRIGQNYYYVSARWIDLDSAAASTETKKEAATETKEETVTETKQETATETKTDTSVEKATESVVENVTENKSTALSGLTDEVVAERINQIYEALGGTYFTSDGKASSSAVDTRCNVVNVLKSNSKVRALNKANKGSEAPDNNYYMPGHYFHNGDYALLGYSCCGFANYAEWYIAADNCSENLTSKLVQQNIDYTYANMSKYAKSGDICRLTGSVGSGHSVIIVSVESDGCIVLDANSGGGVGDAGKCKVYKYKLKWGSNKITISRSSKRV